MAKRLSDSQKKEIIKGFTSGKNLDELSEQFGCTKLTISRNLKKNFDNDQYTYLLNKNKPLQKSKNTLKKSDHNEINKSNKKYSVNKVTKESFNKSDNLNTFLQDGSFVEIAPLDLNIDSESRKDLSSIPIDEIDLPKTVFMIVDKKIELEIKLLKEYPEWLFLPEDDLNKKTIKIYSELKDAKKFCKKDYKVIKVPNSNVFKIASRFMLSKGISRIISDKQLIAL